MLEPQIHTHPLAPIGELTSISMIAGAVIGALPIFATILAIVWYMICIYDSRPVRRWRARRLWKKHKEVNHE